MGSVRFIDTFYSSYDYGDIYIDPLTNVVWECVNIEKRNGVEYYTYKFIGENKNAEEENSEEGGSGSGGDSPSAA